MTYEELIERLDPSVYQNLKLAVELGKWPDGRVVSKEQRAICMEAVLYYEKLHDIPEQERVGYIYNPKKEGSSCGSKDDADPVRIIN
ncbi:MAG: YeaC family protein [Marinobacter sp.]|nr:YeaC family protein [Marinobacter sp.]